MARQSCEYGSARATIKEMEQKLEATFDNSKKSKLE